MIRHAAVLGGPTWETRAVDAVEGEEQAAEAGSVLVHDAATLGDLKARELHLRIPSVNSFPAAKARKVVSSGKYLYVVDEDRGVVIMGRRNHPACLHHADCRSEDVAPVVVQPFHRAPAVATWGPAPSRLVFLLCAMARKPSPSILAAFLIWAPSAGA